LNKAHPTRITYTASAFDPDIIEAEFVMTNYKAFRGFNPEGFILVHKDELEELEKYIADLEEIIENNQWQ